MDKQAIEKIEELVDERNEIVKIDGAHYSRQKLVHIDPERENEIACNTLRVSTLTGLVDFIEDPKNAELVKDAFIHVKSYNEVLLKSHLKYKRKIYELIVEALYDGTYPDNYDTTPEQMIIYLQTKFLPTSDQGRLVKILSNFKVEYSIENDDDGVTQIIEQKSGVHLKQKEKVDPIAILKPYRTFMEIEQPLSEFLFRIRKDNHGVSANLYLTDGGIWKQEAILRIKEYLSGKLQGKDIPIIA